MTSDPTTAPDAESAAAPAGETPVLGYRALSRKIASRTTSLLAIAILAVALLSVGGYLSEWWNRDEPAVVSLPSTASAQSWDATGAGLTLQFGDLPFTVDRRTISGDAEAATALLTARCRRLTAEAQAPSQPATERETNLIRQLAPEKRVDGKLGRWSLYRIRQPLPMVVGTRDAATVDGKPGRRVVCWGTAFPVGRNVWRTFIMRPVDAEARTSTAGAAGEVFHIPPPPSGRRVMAVREPGGRAWLSATGHGQPADWVLHYSKWFADRGWQRVGDWTAGEFTWSARYARTDETGSWTVDVQISIQSTGTVTVLIAVESART